MFGGSKKSAEPVVAGTEEEEISTNQEAIPVPYIAGTRKVAVRWFTNVYNQFTKEIQVDMGKKGSKKGGTEGSGTYEYYGSLAGAVCLGQVDELVAIAVDGKQVWANPEGNANRETWPTHYQGTIPGYGMFHFYWGTDTQTLASGTVPSGGSILLYRTGAQNNDKGEDHPDYRGTAFIEFRNFLFGREKVSAPNIEVVISRKPAQSLIIGTSSLLNDKQCNPLTAAAELMTNTRYGLGMSADLFDSDSFQDAADDLETVKALTYCSPFLNKQEALREVIGEVSLMSDSFLTWDADSATIKAGVWPHGNYVPPETTPVIQEEDLTESPDLDASSWSGISTGWDVLFADRERMYKESSEKYDDLRLRELTGESTRESLRRDWITRRNQALAYATEWSKSVSRPVLTGELVVRRKSAALLTVGQYFKLDIDVEPGGAQLLQICRCLEKSNNATGSVTVKFAAETNLIPVAYAPPPTGRTDSTTFPYPSALAFVRPVEMPPSLSGTEYGLSVLAQRQDNLTVGFGLYYDNDNVGAYSTLGTQRSFAIRADLLSPYDVNKKSVDEPGYDPEIDAPVLDLTESNFTDLLAFPDNIGLVGARNDQFLLILMEIETSGERAGQIELDDDGYAKMEILSISESYVNGGPNTRTIQALRNRFSTRRQGFSIGAEAWLVRRSALKIFTHRDFPIEAAASSPIYFKAEPFNIFQTRDVSEEDPTTFYFPTSRLFAPKITIDPLPSPGPYVGVDYIASGTITDQDGDLASWSLSYIDAGGQETVVAGNPVEPTTEYTFSVPIRFLTAGTYTVIVRAKDSTTFIDSFVEKSVILVATVAESAIEPPTGISTTTAFKAIWLDWTNPNDDRFAAMEIWVSETNDRATASLAITTGAAFAAYPVEDANTRYFWFRSKDISGNLGAFTSVVSGNARPLVEAGDVGANEIIANTANIANAVITSAKIIDLSASKIAAGTVGAAEIVMGGASSVIRSSLFDAANGWQIKGDGSAIFANAEIRKTTVVASGSTNFIKSAGYVPGTSGWAIRGDGFAEFQDVLMYGKVPQPSLFIGGVNVSGGGVFASTVDLKVITVTGTTVYYSTNGTYPNFTTSVPPAPNNKITVAATSQLVLVAVENATSRRSEPLLVPISINFALAVGATSGTQARIQIRTNLDTPYMLYVSNPNYINDIPSSFPWSSVTTKDYVRTDANIIDGRAISTLIVPIIGSSSVAYCHSNSTSVADRVGGFYRRYYSLFEADGTPNWTAQIGVNTNNTTGGWTTFTAPGGTTTGDSYPY